MRTRAKTIDGVWSFYFHNSKITHAQLIKAFYAVSVFLLTQTEPSEALENCVACIGRFIEGKSSNTEMKRYLYGIRSKNEFVYQSWIRENSIGARSWFVNAGYTLKLAVKFLHDNGDTQVIGKISAAEAKIVAVFKQALESMEIAP